MSFMPNVGTVVRMEDGRIATVSNIDPLGHNDRVRYRDGHEENTDAWKIDEVLDMSFLFWTNMAKDEAIDLGDPLLLVESFKEIEKALGSDAGSYRMLLSVPAMGDQDLEGETIQAVREQARRAMDRKQYDPHTAWILETLAGRR